MVDSVANSSQNAIITPFQKRQDAQQLNGEDRKAQDSKKTATARAITSSDTKQADDRKDSNKVKDLRVAANQSGSTQRTGNSRGSLVDVTV